MLSDHDQTSVDQCCRDEAFMRLTEYGVGTLADFNFDEELSWWLEWSRRRDAQLAGWLADVLRAAATEGFNSVSEIQNWLSMMHKRYLGTLPEKKPNPEGEGAVLNATE